MATDSLVDPSAARRGRVAAVAMTMLIAGTSALFVWWTSEQRLQRDAIEQLPAPERRALYDRTLRTLASACGSRPLPEGLQPYCQEQADFILQFAECDEACKRLARPHQSRPMR